MDLRILTDHGLMMREDLEGEIWYGLLKPLTVLPKLANGSSEWILNFPTRPPLQSVQCRKRW